MSTDLKVLQNNLPAYLRTESTVNAETLVSGGETLPKVSIKGRQFRFIKDGEERALDLGTKLDLVILGASPAKGHAKAFFEGSYSEESADQLPTCSSADGIAPDGWVETPCATRCAICPNNEFGSGTKSDGTASKGKACRDSKRLLVIAPDAPQSDIYILQVPPTSLKELSSYARKLVQHKIPIEGVVTRLDFEDAEYPQLKFEVKGFTNQYNSKSTDDIAQQFLDRAKSDEVKDIMLASTTEEPVAEKAEGPKEVVSTETGEVTKEPAKEPSNNSEDLSLELPDGSFAVDRIGVKFDDALHSRSKGAMGGHLTKGGVFVARRNVKKPVIQEANVPESQPTKEPEAQSDAWGETATQGEAAGDAAGPEPSDDTSEADLNDLLDNWG